MLQNIHFLMNYTIISYDLKKINGKCFVTTAVFFLHEIESNNFGPA